LLLRGLVPKRVAAKHGKALEEEKMLMRSTLIWTQQSRKLVMDKKVQKTIPWYAVSILVYSRS